jgi:chaperonin GroES
MAKEGKIRPLGDQILIRRVEAQSMTKGGIVLPDSAKEKPKEGIVLALGDGRLLESGERKPFQVKLEDRVLFSSYAGTEIKIDGEDLLLIREEEILAVIE